MTCPGNSLPSCSPAIQKAYLDPVRQAEEALTGLEWNQRLLIIVSSTAAGSQPVTVINQGFQGQLGLAQVYQWSSLRKLLRKSLCGSDIGKAALFSAIVITEEYGKVVVGIQKWPLWATMPVFTPLFRLFPFHLVSELPCDLTSPIECDWIDAPPVPGLSLKET